MLLFFWPCTPHTKLSGFVCAALSGLALAVSVYSPEDSRPTSGHFVLSQFACVYYPMLGMLPGGTLIANEHHVMVSLSMLLLMTR